MEIRKSEHSTVVTYNRTLSTGRKTFQSVEVTPSPFFDEKPTISITAANLQLEDIPEFIKAVKLATMIASGELEIE